MKKNSFTKRLGILLFIFLLQVFPISIYASAEAMYTNPIQISLPYKHIYTTTDNNADSIFHFIISPKDESPLPYEADKNGIFTINGKSENEEKTKSKSVYKTDGNLSFEFQKPGVYCYEIKADLTTDEKKKNASSYKFSGETISVSFYVEGSSETGDLQINMLTAQNTKNEKINEIVFKTTFDDNTTSNPSSTPTGSVPTYNNPTTPLYPQSSNYVSSESKSIFKTGDERHIVLSFIILTLSAVTFILLNVLSKQEDE